MGYTSFTIELIEKALQQEPWINNVIDYGSQQLYLNERINGDYADTYYKSKGITYTCLDLNGDNNALQYDLSQICPIKIWVGLVCDMGFSEHVVQAELYPITTYSEKTTSVYPLHVTNIEKGYYYCWLNKHNMLPIGGIMVNENPESKSWPGHCYHWITTDFYTELCKIADYEIIELGRHPSMNNTTDGWNVYSILRKTGSKFPSLEQFNKLPIFRQ